jgi:hypothetical protein
MTKFADGTFENEVHFRDDANTVRAVITRSDGTQTVRTTFNGVNEKGEQIFSDVTLDETGALVERRDGVTHADGSQTIVVRDQPGASRVVATTTTTIMPDGAIRQHVTRFDGTDETVLMREYKTADGAQVREVQSDDNVQIVTTRADGSHSDVTRFEDGTFESNDTVVRPDGTQIHTRTNRDQTFVSTEQQPDRRHHHDRR